MRFLFVDFIKIEAFCFREISRHDSESDTSKSSHKAENGFLCVWQILVAEVRIDDNILL